MDIAPKTKDSDLNSVYYDVSEGDSNPETTTMHSRKASAPLTTTPVKPVIGDQVVANKIQERRKGSKGSDDDRRGHHTVKRYELVDEGPVGDRRRYREHADDVDEESEGREYEEENVVQRRKSPESEGWLPAIDEALPRQTSGKRSKSVGQTRSVWHDEMRSRSASLRRGNLYDHDESRDEAGGRQRNWGEPSGTAKKSASMRSAGTTGTTLTTDDGRVLRASAFLPNGAGMVGPGSRVRVVEAEDGQQKNKGKTKSGFGWGLGIGKKDKIERELEKVVRAEGKTEKRALRDAVKEMDGLRKVQKDAVKNESQAQTKLTALLSTLHKSELTYLHARREHETMLAAVRAQEEIVLKVREGAREATERVREKAGEVSALKSILERDETERAKP